MSENPDVRWVVRGPDDLGAVIREARGVAGWTQQQLADAAGLHRSDLSGLERGRHSRRVWRLLRLLRTLEPDVMVSTRDTNQPWAL